MSSIPTNTTDDVAIAATATAAAAATSSNASVASATNVATSTFIGGPLYVNNHVSHGSAPTPFMFGSTQTNLGGDGSSDNRTESVGATPFGSMFGSTSSGSIGLMYGSTVGAFGSNITGYGHIPVTVQMQTPRAKQGTNIIEKDFNKWDQHDLVVVITEEVNLVENQGAWYIDTDVTVHVCFDKTHFSSYKPVEGRKLSMANQASSEVAGIGDV